MRFAKPWLFSESQDGRSDQTEVPRHINPRFVGYFHAGLLVMAVNLEALFGNESITLGVL